MVTYFFRKKSIRYLFHFLDLFLKVPISKKPFPKNPKSLLICQPAHLGDVILTTTLLPLLKQTYPLLKIGMLVSSKSFQTIENHPLIDSIHLVDHWKLNRSPISLFQKIKIYYKSRKKALQEIQNYEISIDCNFHFPNLAPLMWQAKIPIRTGYRTAGFSTLLTHPISWQKKEQSCAHYFLDLLQPLGITGNLKPNLPEHHFEYDFPKLPKNAVVIHIGTGDPQKKWPKENWKEFLQGIDPELDIYFTGFGKEEHAEIQELIFDYPHFHNLANQLSWKEFVSLIRHAKFFVGVDSCGGHIASAFDVPSLLIYSNSSSLWRPLSSTATILMQPTVEKMLKYFKIAQ